MFTQMENKISVFLEIMIIFKLLNPTDLLQGPAEPDYEWLQPKQLKVYFVQTSDNKFHTGSSD